MFVVTFTVPTLFFASASLIVPFLTARPYFAASLSGTAAANCSSGTWPTTV